MGREFRKLTRPFIRKLLPGAKLTEYGITFERLRNGDGVFSVNVMVDGHRIHRVIGRESDGVTRTQAEEFIVKVRSEAREGRLSLPTGRKTHLSFAEAAQRYIERLEQTNGKNLTAKRRQLGVYLVPFIGNQRLSTVSTFLLERYKRRRLDAGAANGTINLELATLSHLFNCATEWGWLKSLPCKIHLLQKTEGRIVALTNEQADALMKAAIDDEDPQCWLFVAFGLNTAMRHREILRARFDELNLDRRRIFVPKAKGSRREQPITAELTEILRKEVAARGGNDEWIFPSPRPKASSTGYRDRMSKPFRTAVVRAGLNPKLVTPHVMRHTAITSLVQSGADLPTIQKITGHKTLAMVLRYTHVHGLHVDRAIAAIGRALPEPTANKSRDTPTQEFHTAEKNVIRLAPTFDKNQ
jgi:integrase